MPQKFLTHLEQVSRRRSSRRRVAVTCWALAGILLAAVVLIGLDRGLGIVDPVGRVLWTGMFITICVWVLKKWTTKLREAAVTPLQVAQEIEEKQPELRDLISSAWDFGQQSEADNTSGSESLRRAVVLHAATAIEEVDWQHFIPRQALRKASLALLCVVLPVILFAWYLPQNAAIGFSRLVNPFSSVEWPRVHDLEFLEPPSRLIAGEDLVLRLHDTQAELPTEVTIHYRTRLNGRWQQETRSLAPTAQPLEIRKSNVQGELQFRATGGDHQTMAWHKVEVVEPPKVEAWQVMVHPPAYTGLQPEVWNHHAEIYVGSSLSSEGSVDQSVKQVSLLNSAGEQAAVQLSEDGLQFRIEPSAWRAEKSDIYTLQLTTLDGLKVPAAAEIAIDVIADRPPEVRILQPTSELTVLPNASVPLVIEASDEFGVHEIGLVYHRSDKSEHGEQRIALWKIAAPVEAAERIRTKQIDYLWQLAPLSIEPGSSIEVRARAVDGQPATGQTAHVLRIEVVSEEQLWQQFLQQQTIVVEILQQLLSEQRDLQAVTFAWEELAEKLDERWANACHTALYRQRRIADTLVGGQGSVIVQLDTLSKTIESNRLMRPDDLERLQNARAVLQALVDEPLVAAEKTLRELARISQELANSRERRPLFKDLGQNQEQVVAGLRRAIDLLQPGNIVGRFEQELVELETDQRALARHCEAEIVPQQFQQNSNDPEDKTKLASAASRQRELARRFSELMLEMAQASITLADEQPTLAARLSNTRKLAEKLGTQSTIQAAAEELTAQRLGRVLSLQQRVLEDFAKLRARIAGRDMQGAAERLERLETTERELQRLRRQVEDLDRELRKLNPEQKQRELERLRRQREQLAKQAEEVSRQLERLRMPKAAQAASDAASQLGKASLESESTKQAKQKLDDAQRQLTNERRRQQVALARLEMAQLDAKLGSLVGRQQSIEQEIKRLEDLQQQNGELSNAQQKSVKNLIERQADVREEAVRQAESLKTLPVFGHLLNQAGETMQAVEERLSQDDLGPATQESAAEASRQLNQLVDALKQEQEGLDKKNNEGGGSGEGQSGDTAQEKTLQLALGQLKLLKTLQTTLREKTQRLEQEQVESQAQIDLARRLARQQQQLTDLAQQLVPEPPDPPTEEFVPDLDKALEQSLEEIQLPLIEEER